MTRGCAWLATLLLAACASAPPAVTVERHFLDARFSPPSERIDPSDVLALSEPMRRYVQAEIAGPAHEKGRQRALIDALYGRGELRLEYDTEFTRNAAQAFAARSGNCLSLVLMTAAFAKELGLSVTFQKVYVDDVWARSGDLYLAIGHVNVTLGRSHIEGLDIGFRAARTPLESESMTIDFLPPQDLRAARTRAIAEDVVIAMYLNNRAVESMAAGRLDDAYWWARAAIVQAPAHLSAYNTLGGVYLRHGDLDAAARAFTHVLDEEPFNTEAMSNQVAVLRALGRGDEAERLAAQLARLEPEPPFSHFRRGMAALRAGDARTAKEAFEREVARSPEYHEFHFWLAIALLNLGENDAARGELELALRNSTTRRDHDLYAAKLARLRLAR
jgi:Tfp pilus assembly protein PilF